jgi:hypothetical protein
LENLGFVFLYHSYHWPRLTRALATS